MIAFFSVVILALTFVASLFRRKPKQKPQPTIPLARALYDAQWRSLERPTVTRQREIRSALGWERFPVDAEQ